MREAVTVDATLPYGTVHYPVAKDLWRFGTIEKLHIQMAQRRPIPVVYGEPAKHSLSGAHLRGYCELLPSPKPFIPLHRVQRAEVRAERIGSVRAKHFLHDEAVHYVQPYPFGAVRPLFLV